MRKRMFLAIVIGLFFLAGNSWAFPILNVGDDIGFNKNNTLYQTYGTTNGGEFAVFLYNGAVRETDVLFKTFCLEKNEYLDYSTKFNIDSIESYAVRGGISGASLEDGQYRDYLSLETKYLFYHYAIGDLANLTALFSYATDTSANLLQNAFWILENEITGPNNLVTWAVTQVAHLSSQEWSEIQRVKVLNISYHSGTLGQSQLYLATPEPVSMLLFGTGLVTVGGFIRRKLKK